MMIREVTGASKRSAAVKRSTRNAEKGSSASRELSTSSIDDEEFLHRDMSDTRASNSVASILASLVG